MTNTTREQQIGKHDFYDIIDLIQDYFDGLYEADTKKLERIFHPDAYLNAPNLRRSLSNWLEVVSTRPVPQDQKQSYHFKIMSIEIVADQAVVKVDCPLYEFQYIDYLSLLKENGRWLIVNKMYTDTRGK